MVFAAVFSFLFVGFLGVNSADYPPAAWEGSVTASSTPSVEQVTAGSKGHFEIETLYDHFQVMQAVAERPSFGSLLPLLLTATGAFLIINGCWQHNRNVDDLDTGPFAVCKSVFEVKNILQVSNSVLRTRAWYLGDYNSARFMGKDQRNLSPQHAMKHGRGSASYTLLTVGLLAGLRLTTPATVLQQTNNMHLQAAAVLQH